MSFGKSEGKMGFGKIGSAEKSRGIGFRNGRREMVCGKRVREK